MKADLTRLTFDPSKHYRGVHQQQGRVQLDSDWNEQTALVSHRVETETVDVVGHCGAPVHDDGFRLVPNLAALTPDEAARPGNAPLNPAPPAGDLLLTAGRFYAGGVLAVNERLVPVSLQPELPAPAELAASGLPSPLRPAAPGTYLAYLDVWPRHRTALEDPVLREVALGGPDTATRTKNTWQVKFLSVPAGTTCASPLPAWDALVKPALGTLSAELVTAPASNSPCIVEPGSGYRRLENQLYRVEVHQGGASLAQTTFKWSRDNGSVVAKWVGKQAGSLDLQVENTGRDKVLGLSENQWVELTDDTREELGVPGLFVQIDKVEGDIVRLKAPHNAASEFAKFPRHPKLRRWEGRPASAPGKWLGPDGNEKTLSASANAAGLFELEDGVAVRFGAGAFRTGDYWLIPARTAKPQLDWPLAPGATTAAKVPPHGVPHHYCKLAVVTVPSGNAAPVISDCRPLFPPLTELTSLFYVGGDAQSATPNPTLPAAAILPPLPLPLEVGVANGEHPVAGARIRFTITSGGGQLSAVDADGVALTGPDGVARATWALRNSDPAGNPGPGHRVTAELVDPAATRVHLPVVFHATLDTAAKVAYDPARCAEMSAVPVVTVQDALDFLCARKEDRAGCCYSVGELDGVPGDFPTLKEALAALLSPNNNKEPRPAVCLSLLPGEHLVEKELLLEAEKRAILKLNGCNHAARLVLEAPVLLRGFAGVVIRDLSIQIDGPAALRFERCQLVEIAGCLVVGRTTLPALLAFGQVGRLLVSQNLLRAHGAKKPGDTKALGPVELEKALGARTDADYAKHRETFVARHESLSAAERAAAAAKLNTEIALAESRLTPAETVAYKSLAETLANPGPDVSRALDDRLSRLRALARERRTEDFMRELDRAGLATSAPAPEAPSTRPGAGAPGTVAAADPAPQAEGVVLLFEDGAADLTLVDNHVLGEVRHLGDGARKGPLTASDIKRLDTLMPTGAVVVRPARGSLRVRGNTLGRFAWGDAFADQLREIVKNHKGEVELWAAAHFTDNRFLSLDNAFAAARLTMTGNLFVGESGDVPRAQSFVLAQGAVFTGNSSDAETRIHHFTVARVQSGNLGIKFQPPIP